MSYMAEEDTSETTLSDFSDENENYVKCDYCGISLPHCHCKCPYCGERDKCECALFDAATGG